MTIFQKLSWMQQMGIRVLCGEVPHALEYSKKTVKGASLAELDKSLNHSKSALSATATHPIGGIGMVPAKVMCVLEMPSAGEDKTGQPLSGPEGELLQKMLSAIGLNTDTQTYVSYLSPWRSPGSRVLTSTEIQEGKALLDKRIRLVQPQILLVFGMSVARALLGVPLGEARSKVHVYQGIPVFTSFAPNFLIKNTAYKKQAWADLKKLATFLEKHS